MKIYIREGIRQQPPAMRQCCQNTQAACTRQGIPRQKSAKTALNHSQKEREPRESTAQGLHKWRDSAALRHSWAEAVHRDILIGVLGTRGGSHLLARALRTSSALMEALRRFGNDTFRLQSRVKGLFPSICSSGLEVYKESQGQTVLNLVKSCLIELHKNYPSGSLLHCLFIHLFWYFKR